MTPVLPNTVCCPAEGHGDLLPLALGVVVLVAASFVARKLKQRQGTPSMKVLKKAMILVLLFLALIGVWALKTARKSGGTQIPEPVASSAPALVQAGLPRLVDLGATKCISCKLMAAILAELKTAYAGQLQVEFIDVWENPDAGNPYGIQTIPTQIFFDVQGREVFRHEGYFPKEDILAKWKELGVALTAPAPAPTP